MSGEFSWAIKASLLEYVGQIPDVAVELTRGASGDLSAGFQFPIADSGWTAPGDVGSVRMLGSVVLRGYGVQICRVEDPQIAFDRTHGVLSVRRWANREAMLDVARFETDAAGTDGTRWRWSTVTLLPQGRELFDFRYEEGAELAEIELPVRTPARAHRAVAR